MLKYISKFTLDILPSVVATIVGAYIVNHYIVAKPAANAPVAAAVSSADPKKADGKSSETPAIAGIPEPGVKAKGISEKAIIERSAAEKAQEKLTEKPAEKPAEKSADRPSETANIPVETRRHQPGLREKPVARAAQPSSAPSVSGPLVAAPNTIPPVEAAIAADERRDANDLARAAIERLRGSSEAPRGQDSVRIQEAPRPVPTMVQPLPPPIMVSTPPFEARPPFAPAARIDDPHRLTPPADIPGARPLDLHAEAAAPSPRDHTTVAEDMLSAAKSVFHAVLPK